MVLSPGWPDFLPGSWLPGGNWTLPVFLRTELGSSRTPTSFYWTKQSQDPPDLRGEEIDSHFWFEGKHVCIKIKGPYHSHFGETISPAKFWGGCCTLLAKFSKLWDFGLGIKLFWTFQ